MELARYLNVLWWFYKHTFKHQKKNTIYITITIDIKN